MPRKKDPYREEADIILAQLRAEAARSLERVTDTFKRWDADGGGKISRVEFKKAAARLFIEGDPRALDAAFDILDADRSGEIDVNELSEHLLEHRRSSGREAMNTAKAMGSSAPQLQPIKLSSLALSKSDSNLAQFKANAILRSTESLDRATEMGRQWEHDWRVYDASTRHTEQILNRKIVERAAEVKEIEDRRTEAIREKDALERQRLHRRLNAYSASRHKREAELAQAALETQRLVQSDTARRMSRTLTRTMSRFGGDDEKEKELSARHQQVEGRAITARAMRERLFKSLNEAYEERRSTSLKLREELREQDDKRLKAVVDRQKSRLASHEATLETKAAQHEARASYDAQRRQKLHEAAVAHKASEEQRRREKNLLAGSASLARLAGDKEAQQAAMREQAAAREAVVQQNFEQKAREAAEREARLRQLAAATAQRVAKLDDERTQLEREVQARLRKGVQTRAALYDAQHKSQTTTREPQDVRRLLSSMGGVFLT